MMSKKIKLIALGAAIILLTAAAFAIIFFSGGEGGGTEKMLAEAGEYLDSRDYDNAIAIYNRIISDEPECAEAYAGLSEAYYAKGRTDKAFEVLEKGAENTDYNEIILNKSEELFPEINLENSYYEEAEEFFTEEITTVTTTEITEITTETVTEITETSSETTTEITTTTAETTTTTAPAATTTVRTTTTAPVTTTKPVTTTTAATTTAPVTTAKPVTTTTAATTTAPVTTTTIKLKEYTVPDFTLMTLDDAYAWCSKHNIILNAVGGENNSEEILSQSPAPGSTVKENSEIIVILN